MTASATFQNGNKEITVNIASETNRWENGDMIRDYFDLGFDDKRRPISKLYEVISGSTRDQVIEVNGRTFAYELGIDCNSKTKRRSAVEAIETLVKAL